MSTRPVTLGVAAIVEALEGIIVLGAGLYVGVEAIIGRPHDLVSAIALAFMAVLGGIGVLTVAWGLWRARRWGRAPALLTQIFTTIVAVSMIQSGRHVPGGVLVMVAVIGAIALLSPPTTRALVDE